MNWGNILSTLRMHDSRREKDLRNEFESDYGRVIFSPALRRMHDKTQVFPLVIDDHIHTRLSHSLEVQSVAYSLGINIIKNSNIIKRLPEEYTEFRFIPKILSTVALAHDIGNPPFGHYGEIVIQDYFKNLFNEKKNKIKLTNRQKLDFTLFNGNAQGFRVLTRLQLLQDIFGLNLTMGTLSVYLKYPCLAEEIKSGHHEYQKKVGIFQSEKDILMVLRKETKLKKIRNPLSFLVEAADSICYHVMDIEDGFNKKYYKYDTVINYLRSSRDPSIIKYMKNYELFYKKMITNNINKETSSMVTLRIFLIQRLVDETIEIFLKNLAAIEKGTFGYELIYRNPKGLGRTLFNFEKEFIFKKREIQAVELTGESVIKGLLDCFIQDILQNKKRGNKLESLISSSIKTAAMLQENKKSIQALSHYMKLRMIVDYISGMTDSFALELYRKLEGIHI